ncbi:MAG: AI-2E family transporter [Ruminococcaceae bacterium]|nr:AI-2E family transporter [Oscillospiraceae bacterium]
MEKQNKQWKRWLWAFLFGAALITVYKTFDNFTHIFKFVLSFLGLLKPFTIGLVLAFFLYPATVRLEEVLEKSRWKCFAGKKKTIATLTVYFGVLAVFLLVMWLVLPWLSASMADLLKKAPVYVAQLNAYVEGLAREGGFLERLHLEHLIEDINVEKIIQNFFKLDALDYVEGVKGVTGLLSNWFMGIVICAYALLERDSLFGIARRTLSFFMKKEKVETAGLYAHKISGIFYKFFFGKVIDSLIVGVLCFAGFGLLGIPYAALLAIVVMVFNMIPYFGSIIGAIPAVLVALITKDIYFALWTALFLLAVQQFDGLWLGPKILGNSIGVSPFWVIFAIVVFGGIFGLWGMILGVPVIAIIQMLATDYFDDRKVNASVEEEEKE